MSADPEDTASPQPREARRTAPTADRELAGRGTIEPVTVDHPGNDDVLDVPAAARLLRVGRNTIYDLVARNAIPHRRLGKQIRFSRAAIMRWCGSWSSQGAKEGQ